jgi:hypothetical protein
MASEMKQRKMNHIIRRRTILKALAAAHTGSQAHKRQNRTEHTAFQIPHGTNSQAAARDKLAESGIQIYQSSSTKRMAHTQQRLRLYCAVVAYATSQPVLPE